MKDIRTGFCVQGKADCTIGGQFGSEGKGAAVGWLAKTLMEAGKRYDFVTTNASSQAGHTVIHNDTKYVTRHLPTAPLVAPGSAVILNAGCAIDPDVFEQEMIDYDYVNQCNGFMIHPNAAVITKVCIEAESRDDSPQTKISSTRKGVGQAIARKVLRSGMIAKDHPYLKKFCVRFDLQAEINWGKSVLVEIPQGYGLSLNGRFYPYCTSRDCSVMQGLSDAAIHPHSLGKTLMVLRTYPIRVGSLPGHSSGDFYKDQKEIKWEDIDRPPELTTVTGRERRLFTWSHHQVDQAMRANRPDAVFLSHADYVEDVEPMVLSILSSAGKAPVDTSFPIAVGNGPTTDDVQIWSKP
jgi:adenylosuccinate synthase